MSAAILLGACGILILFAIILIGLMISSESRNKSIANILSNHRNAIRTIEKMVKNLENSTNSGKEIEIVDKRLTLLEHNVSRLSLYLDMKLTTETDDEYKKQQSYRESLDKIQNTHR